MATPVAIFLSGLAGSIIALWSIISAREVSRKKAAMEFLLASFDNQLYRDAYSTIRKLHSSADSEIEIFAYEQGLDEAGLKTRANILYLLNYHESIAVAINRGIFDELTVKETRFTSIVRTWKMTRQFVYKLREQLEIDTVYMEFEELAEHWKENPLNQRPPFAERKKRWWRFYQTN